MLPAAVHRLAHSARSLVGQPIVHHGSVRVSLRLSAEDAGWTGYVEFFTLERDASARVFAWYWDAQHESGINVVLNAPPVGSPYDAVLMLWEQRKRVKAQRAATAMNATYAVLASPLAAGARAAWSA
jgi:hypothetical protein